MRIVTGKRHSEHIGYFVVREEEGSAGDGMRRAFTAPCYEDRCKADITLRSDGSAAQCMRGKVDGELCKQHAHIAAAFSCEYCGGNDEPMTDHCMDCARPEAAK